MQKYRKTFCFLSFVCLLLSACTGSGSDEKAIWLYEQHQSVQTDFRFYPDYIKQVGVITAKDSVSFYEHAMGRPINTLMQENRRELQNLLQLQTVYVQNDMELQREDISEQIRKLEDVQIWLGKVDMQCRVYKMMLPQKVLVRKVECRFSYNDLLSGKKISKDKIYLLHVASGNVLSSKDK